MFLIDLLLFLVSRSLESLAVETLSEESLRGVALPLSTPWLAECPGIGSDRRVELFLNSRSPCRLMVSFSEAPLFRELVLHLQFTIKRL